MESLTLTSWLLTSRLRGNQGFYFLASLIEVNKELRKRRLKRHFFILYVRLLEKTNQTYRLNQLKPKSSLFNSKLVLRRERYILDKTVLVLGIGVVSAIALGYFILNTRDARISVVAPLILTPIKKGFVLSGNGTYFRYTQAAFEIARRIKEARQSGILGTDLATTLDTLGEFFRERSNMNDLIPYFFTYSNTTIPSTIVLKELAELCGSKVEIMRICQKITRLMLEEAQK